MERRQAFTLVELLVVIGIIAVLISILLPTLGRVRAQGVAVQCASNLRQLGLATQMYLAAHRNMMPYPTTTFGESALWFTALDPFLGAIRGRPNATGVAAERAYARYKQCPVWSVDGNARASGNQDTLWEFARTYKMNSFLRKNNLPPRPNPTNPSTTTTYGPARVTEIRNPSNFVYLGDGLSIADVGEIPSLFESGQFSMDINDPQQQATPALRHMGGANILFVDGHVELVKLPTIEKRLRDFPNIRTRTWEGEYLRADGSMAILTGGVTQTMEQLGLRRNPNMPYQWSELGKLYR